MHRIALGVVFGIAVVWGGTACAADVIWDGGDGLWNDSNWNGGQDAITVMGSSKGTDGGHDVSISGDVTVTYDQNLHGDFTFRQNNGPSSLTISSGATLTMNEDGGAADGQWTRWDATYLVLDGGTFSRTFTPGPISQSGGLMAIASWNSNDNEEINIILKNGGRIEHDGIFLVGYEDEMGANVSVNIIIYDGHLDLTGGDNYPMGDLNWANDLVMTSIHPDDYLQDGSTLANFKPSINFRGPGSITVDEGGIAIPHKWFGFWEDVTTLRSYEDLWNLGFLKSHGESGSGGAAFGNFFTTTGSPGSADYQLEYKEPATVVWDGGDGIWNDSNWNGGQDANTAMGSTKGTNGGHAVIIGGGATVTYQQNLRGDFTFRTNNGISSLSITEGATLTMDENGGAQDGQWTRWDATFLNIDGGTFSRTLTPGPISESGGMMAVASWNSKNGQEININITNGGRIEHDGVFLIGYEDEMGADVTVTITIDDGHMDLTGGDNYAMGDLSWANDLVITTFDEAATLDDNDTPANFNPSINFIGPGSITVDEGGIANPHKDASNSWQDITTLVTYEQLWNLGLLKANGMSGLDGEIFGDYFAVTGASGSADYKLTSLLGSVESADFDGDGDVDGADFLAWQAGFGIAGGATLAQGDANGDGNVNAADLTIWQAQFGTSGASANGSAIPEPAAWTLALMLCLLGSAGRRFRKA